MVLLLRQGELLTFGAHHGPIPVDYVQWPISRGWASGRAVMDRKPVPVHDLTVAGDEFPVGRAMALRLGARSRNCEQLFSALPPKDGVIGRQLVDS